VLQVYRQGDWRLQRELDKYLISDANFPEAINMKKPLDQSFEKCELLVRY
jgi:hypothetical protein